MRAFAYERAETLDQGLGALGAGARVLAGGTDLIPLMQQRVAQVARVVDVSRLDGSLRALRAAAGGGLWLGAMATLADVAGDESVRRAYPALAQAAASVGTPQIRNVATVGGNLCQLNRCWYFRSGVACHLNGGDACPAAAGDHRFHAVFAHGPCIAVHPSDLAVALLALGARVRVAGPGGEREVDLGAFLLPPGPDRPDQTALVAGELVTGVLLPPPSGRSAFLKAMERRAWAFALASAAVALEVEGGRVARAAIALGGVGAVPRAADAAAAALLGGPLDEESAARAADLAVAGVAPLPGNAYKVDLVRRLVRGALLELAAGAAGA